MGGEPRAWSGTTDGGAGRRGRGAQGRADPPHHSGRARDGRLVHFSGAAGRRGPGTACRSASRPRPRTTSPGPPPRSVPTRAGDAWAGRSGLLRARGDLRGRLRGPGATGRPRDARPCAPSADVRRSARRGRRSWPSSGPTAAGKSEVALEVAARSAVRSSTPMRSRCTAAWTSARPSCPRRSAGGSPPPARHPRCHARSSASRSTRRRAGRSCADLGRRGVPAVVVGGSGLYVRALLDDLRFPGSDPHIRGRGGRRGWPRWAPSSCTPCSPSGTPRRRRTSCPRNGRRIVRALEVGELTGEPFTAQLPADGPPPRGAPERRAGPAPRPPG